MTQSGTSTSTTSPPIATPPGVHRGDPANVVIDLTDSHIWDASTVATLDAITTKYQRYGKTVRLVGLNPSSAERHERLAGQLSAKAVDYAPEVPTR